MSRFYKITKAFCFLLVAAQIINTPITVHAITQEERIAANQSIEVRTNGVTDWPEGPVTSAEAAILIEAETGVILYDKNIHKQEYPASTTKILTTLIALEECEMDEWVTFSHKAVFDVPYDSNHIAMDEGEKLTVEDCLKAILMRSANEVSYAIAEHICGSDWENFAPIMNERAKELGCLNSNFVNPNGLPDENHVTTAYDLAMIGREFFRQDVLCEMTKTRMLHILPTEYQEDEKMEVNKMELIPGGDYEYEYLVGCKTGYTDDARSCLVSCAEKDGMRLICVVLRDEAPYQYEDTIALFNYGFENFRKVVVSEAETKYSMDSDGLFYGENDIFGNSQPILSMNEEDYVVLPKTVDFSEAKSEISYEDVAPGQAAVVNYTFSGEFVGSASIDLVKSQVETYKFETEAPAQELTSVADQKAEETTPPSFLFIDVWKVLRYVLFAAIGVAIIIGVIFFFKNYHFSERRNRFTWMVGKRGRRSYQNDYGEISLRKQRRKQIAEAKRRIRRKRR
ncbi:MAG: D-alanyl-D-alanine carboxypeptidase [Lachnospiraceae bacterium]|nr:D-alanyl-D-alanine carboxypeptidase [Lachnospiraceae bacterium]